VQAEEGEGEVVVCGWRGEALKGGGTTLVQRMSAQLVGYSIYGCLLSLEDVKSDNSIKRRPARKRTCARWVRYCSAARRSHWWSSNPA